MPSVVTPVALPPIASVSAVLLEKFASRMISPPPVKCPEVAKLPIAPSFRFSVPATVSVVAAALPRTFICPPL